MENQSSQLSADNFSKQGKEAYQTGDFATAVGRFLEARTTYEQAGDVTAAAEEANNLSVALLKGGNAKASLEAAQGTDLIFKQAGDIRRQGYALGNQAAALEAMGQRSQAETKYVECAALLEQIDDRDMLPHVKKSISQLRMRSGDSLGAVISMQEALGGKRKLSFTERILKKLFAFLTGFFPK